MRLTKRQLRRIIRESIGTGPNGSVALDHLINCYVDGVDAESCADSMPSEADNEGLQDFANFVMRVVNTYKEYGNF